MTSNGKYDWENGPNRKAIARYLSGFFIVGLCIIILPGAMGFYLVSWSGGSDLQALLGALVSAVCFIFALGWVARQVRYMSGRIDYQFDASSMNKKPDDETIKLDGNKTIIEVPQTGSGIAVGESEIVATPRVWQCTLFTGWCESLKLGFICHPDTPFSLETFPDFLIELNKEIRKAAIKKGLNPDVCFEFESHLLGGKAIWVYPIHTRARLLARLDELKHMQSSMSFKIKEHPMKLAFSTFALSLDVKSGKYDGYKNEIDKPRDGWVLRNARSKDN